MWKKFWTIAAAFLMVASIASVASAQNGGNSGQNEPNGNSGHDQSPRNNGSTGRRTPDGTPPSEEDVCDDLKYGTPGLYGLCIAFCEAHDCIPDYSLDNPYANCKKSDSRILANYKRKMRDGDPEMPCLPGKHDSESNLCPCWSKAQLAMFPYKDQFDNVVWSGMSANINGNYEDDGCSQDLGYIGEGVALADGTFLHFDIAAYNGDCEGTFCSGEVFCEKDDVLGVACPDGVETSNYTPDEITDEEYEACAQQIRDLGPFLY